MENILKDLQMNIKEKILKLSLIQSNPEWENKISNFCKLDSIFEKINDSDLVVLPEMFATGFSMNSHELAEDMNGETVSWMRKHSQKHNFALCGSVIIKEGTKIFNRFVFVTPNELVFYDKRHLFRMGEEELYYNTGDKRVIVKYQGWRILLQVCYDLRFPVWSRNRNDYDLALYTANWPASRRTVWDSLLVARALENQSLVAGCNRIGKDGRDIKYNGGSVIINERGEKLKYAADDCEDVITCKLSLNKLEKFRNDFPAWKDADSFAIDI
jgi:omega-amidase